MLVLLRICCSLQTASEYKGSAWLRLSPEVEVMLQLNGMLKNGSFYLVTLTVQECACVSLPVCLCRRLCDESGQGGQKV